MRIVIATVKNHIYSNYVIKNIIENHRFEIATIIESEVLLHKKRFVPAIIKYLRISGAYYVLAQAFKQESFKIGLLLYRVFNIKKPLSIFFSYKTLAKAYSIPIYETRDINSIESLNLINKLKPDVLVSVFFNQILSKRLIGIPSYCINIHPAYLPNYKGVSPVFWSLANNESYAGVTIHYIDAGIDTGKIIYQQKIPITSNDTEHSLYFKCCEVGVSLLLKALKDIKSEKVHTIEKVNEEESYFSLPSKEAVRQFRKNGRKFFRLRNIKLAFKDYKSKDKLF
jgi:folate-dependent phosphoribosylglycinamide formyltransferase PurN